MLVVPDELMQPDCDGVELSNRMGQHIPVDSHTRVALSEAADEVVH